MRELNFTDFARPMPDGGQEVHISNTSIAEIRRCLERDFSEYLGYTIELRDPPVTAIGDTVAFHIFGAGELTSEDEEEYHPAIP
jgi:hypothetical protein